MRIEARPNTAGEPDAASAPDRDEPSRRANGWTRFRNRPDLHVRSLLGECEESYPARVTVFLQRV